MQVYTLHHLSDWAGVQRKLEFNIVFANQENGRDKDRASSKAYFDS